MEGGWGVSIKRNEPCVSCFVVFLNSENNWLPKAPSFALDMQLIGERYDMVISRNLEILIFRWTYSNSSQIVFMLASKKKKRLY